MSAKTTVLTNLANGHKNLDNVVFNGAVYMRYDHYHQSYSSYTKFNFDATAPESACST